MAILNSKKHLQPKWPLRIGESVGPYESVSSVSESLRQNFTFLLLTIPGEWPMNPDLGVGLAKYLFEDIESLQISDIKSKITNQLKNYLPDLKLLNAEFYVTPQSQDRNIAYLVVSYIVESLGVEDQVIIQAEPNRAVLAAVQIFLGGAENAVKINPEIFRGLALNSLYTIL